MSTSGDANSEECPLCGNEIVRSGMSWHHVVNRVRNCPPSLRRPDPCGALCDERRCPAFCGLLDGHSGEHACTPAVLPLHREVSNGRCSGDLPPLVEVEFEVDRRGDVWRIVRDGGMGARITAHGEIESAGIEWLRTNLGPLVAFDPITYRREYLP